MKLVVPIVEGHGEVAAVEKLLWRIAQGANPQVMLRVNPPIRVKAKAFVNDAGVRQRHVALAAAKARAGRGLLLVLLDSEDDCPAELGPQLAREVARVAGDVPPFIALAHREYESWFVAAAESLRGVGGMARNVVAPVDPERPRDAKGWLSQHMAHRYDPVQHQLAFTLRFDLQAARRVPSFDRLYRRITQFALGN